MVHVSNNIKVIVTNKQLNVNILLKYMLPKPITITVSLS